MTGGQPAPAPDTAGQLTPVTDLESLVKAVIRAATPAHRQGMWDTYSAALAMAALASPSRMPWEPPDAVQSLPDPVATGIVVDVLRSVPDREERKRLLNVAVAQADRINARDPASTLGRHQVRCQRCGRPFTPSSRTQRTCSHACRQGLYLARKRDAEVRASVNGDPGPYSQGAVSGPVHP